MPAFALAPAVVPRRSAAALLAPALAPHTLHPVSRGPLCTSRTRAARAPPSASAGAPSPSSPPSDAAVEDDTPQKAFLKELPALGQVRLIVRNAGGILEVITSFSDLFFATIPSGEYANLIKPRDNVDLHLLLTEFSGARFEVGVSRTKSRAPTYMIRFLGADRESVVLSVFVMWDKEPEDIEPERIDAWKNIKKQYAGEEEDTVFF